MADENDRLCAELQSEPLDFHALFESKDAIEFLHDDGHKEIFTPDGFKGYFPFTVATAFPAGRTQYGIAIHPESLRAYYQTLLDQHVDVDHKMKYNNPTDPNAEDRILGAIVAVSFPRPPNGTDKWKITDKPQPAIKGVGVFWKNAAATQRALSRHMMGNHNSTVSMDLHYKHDNSGFAIAGDAGFAEGTPKEFSEAGYQYVPYATAPADLQACFTMKKSGAEDMIKNYKDKQVTFMAGGIGSEIAFSGLAIVRYGAEPTARLGHLVASHPAGEIFDGLNELAWLIREAGTQQMLKVIEPVAPQASSADQKS